MRPFDNVSKERRVPPVKNHNQPLPEAFVEHHLQLSYGYSKKDQGVLYHGDQAVLNQMGTRACFRLPSAFLVFLSYSPYGRGEQCLVQYVANEVALSEQCTTSQCLVTTTNEIMPDSANDSLFPASNVIRFQCRRCACSASRV